MDKRALLLISAMAVILTACVHGNNSTNATAITAFQARYAPLSGIGPFPNDLYFNGSTTGTLNIPFASSSAAAAPANAALASMNHLDGYGTQSVINAYFTESVDPTSLNAGDVLVFRVQSNPQTKAINPSGTVTPLVPGANCNATTTDYTVGLSSASDAGGMVLNITPCKPLAGGSTYLVVLTNGIKDTNGDAAAPSADYSLILSADLPVLPGQNGYHRQCAARPSGTVQLAAIGGGRAPASIRKTSCRPSVSALSMSEQPWKRSRRPRNRPHNPKAWASLIPD